MSRLARLHDEGQSIWLDNIDRAMLMNGDLGKRVAEDSLTGMTSNPTIFEKALAEGDAYDDQIVNAASKSGAELNVITPLELIVNFPASLPPVIAQVTALSALRVVAPV